MEIILKEDVVNLGYKNDIVTVKSVSYTHLDVYKRQETDHRAWPGRIPPPYVEMASGEQ